MQVHRLDMNPDSKRYASMVLHMQGYPHYHAYACSLLTQQQSAHVRKRGTRSWSRTLRPAASCARLANRRSPSACPCGCCSRRRSLSAGPSCDDGHECAGDAWPKVEPARQLQSHRRRAWLSGPTVMLTEQRSCCATRRAACLHAAGRLGGAHYMSGLVARFRASE